MRKEKKKTDAVEFGIGNAECGIEEGERSDFNTLELEPCLPSHGHSIA
jgi:hypothetical protein